MQGEHERAAMLYMKGGKLSKAVEMCFAAQVWLSSATLPLQLPTHGHRPII
jgi:hypothetical protein